MGQTLGSRAVFCLAFGQRFHRFIELASGMRPAANYSDFLRETVVSGIAVRMEISPEAGKKGFRMFGAPSRLVLVQNNGPVCVCACPVQPHIALALGSSARLAEHLQRRLICMENFSSEQLSVQLFIYGSQIFFCRPQDPVGHGLPGQLDSLAMQLLLLSVQRTAHDKLLGHNMGNGLRCGKAAGNHTLLPGSRSNRGFNVFFAAGLAGVGVVAVLLHNEANGLDAKFFYHFHPDFRKSIPAGRTYQIFSFQTVFHYLGGNAFRNAVQRVLVLFAALVRGHDCSFFLRSCENTSASLNRKLSCSATDSSLFSEDEPKRFCRASRNASRSMSTRCSSAETRRLCA